MSRNLNSENQKSGKFNNNAEFSTLLISNKAKLGISGLGSSTLWKKTCYNSIHNAVRQKAVFYFHFLNLLVSLPPFFSSQLSEPFGEANRSWIINNDAI